LTGWLLILLTACAPLGNLPAPLALNGEAATITLTPFPPAENTLPAVEPVATASATPLPPTETPLPSQTPLPSATPEPQPTFTPSPTPLPAELALDPADWQNWPVLPIVPERARQIYLYGQQLGNDAHAFSVFGDCQSEPPEFLGIFDSDPAVAAALTPELQETVAWFAGSFDRDGPTIRGGTTTGALLWTMWHRNRYTCTQMETPLQCELRIHRPSFVIIHVGSHYENRNEDYMRMILDQLIAAGVVPILATKADNRELDGRVNAAYARLAVEYDLPFWNFWAAVAALPNRGLYTRPEVEFQGDLYLTEQARAIHRLTALQTLDIVRRAVTGP
jgi:hypothetical protein